MAVAKQATTIATQAALPVLDLAVEICTRPWIVELSKNSQRVEEGISLKPTFKLRIFNQSKWKTDVKSANAMNPLLYFF